MRDYGIIILLWVVLLTSCNKFPPERCLEGRFVFSTEPSLELTLGGDHVFHFRREQASVHGTYGYDKAEGDGVIPNTGNIYFMPERRGQSWLSGMVRDHDRADVKQFFESIASGTEAFWPVYQGRDKQVHIIINGDLDHSDLRFDGPHCA